MIPSTGATDYLTQTYTDPARFKDHQFIGNFDYVVNSKHTLSGRFEWERDPLTAPFAVINATVPGNALPGNPIFTEKSDHAALLKLTSILSNNVVNKTRIAYQRYVSNDSILSPFSNSQVGIRDLSAGTDFLSNLTVTGAFSVGAHYFYEAFLPQNQFEWSDQISWSRGKHTFRTGFEAERVQLKQVYPGLSVGQPTSDRFRISWLGAQGAPLSREPVHAASPTSEQPTVWH